MARGSEPAPGFRRQGLLAGLGAYLLWGSVPLFWPLVARAGAVEILAHRVVWSLVISGALLLVMGRRGWWTRVGHPRTLVLLSVAAAVVAVNWGVYIWAVNHGHVVESALGYYINPVISVLLGVIFLGERLARAQWVAVGIAVLAVVVLTLDYGRPPLIALTLAVSFGCYGLLKNRINSRAVDTLVVESAVLTPLAVGYLVALQAMGGLTFGHLGWSHSLLLAATGLVTVIPLLLFSAAAIRIPLSTLGLLQYLTPTAQFLLGVLYFGESMSTARWVGFGLVWLALAVLSGYGLSRAIAGRRPRAVAGSV